MNSTPQSKSNTDISTNNINNLLNEANNIIKKIIFIDETLSHNVTNNDHISELLFDVRKRIFKLDIKLHELLLTRDDKHINILEKKVKFLKENLQILTDFNIQILSKGQKKAIDMLTIINTIFLPLALITGYFGMNFKSMGVPSNTKGIFTVKHGQLVVLYLCIITSIIILWLFYSKILPY